MIERIETSKGIDYVLKNIKVNSIDELGIDFLQDNIHDFRCCQNKLTSLKGCPKIISGDFVCFLNKLTSLEYSPEEMGGDVFSCYNNYFPTLKGCPKIIGSKSNGNTFFVCGNNKNLVDISDMPSNVTQINLENCPNVRVFTKYVDTTLTFAFSYRDKETKQALRNWEYYELINVENDLFYTVKQKTLGTRIIDKV